MGSKLNQVRIAKGISQRRLEQLSGVHQQTISRIEKGYPLNKFTTAKKLAKALDCDISDIIDVDAGFDLLDDQSFKNINNYIKMTRELLGFNPRRAANLLNMEECEYLNCESSDAEVSLDRALTICAALFTEFTRSKLSEALYVKPQFDDVLDVEERVLKALRGLPLKEQERFVHLITATPLIK